MIRGMAALLGSAIRLARIQTDVPGSSHRYTPRGKDVGVAAERDLRRILASLTVSRRDAVYVYVSALAEAGIPCNVLAGFHHDHLLVPVNGADDALVALTALRDEAARTNS